MKWIPVKSGHIVCLALCACLLPAPDTAAAGSEYAMQMKNVASSTLLDIARAGQRLVAVGERGHIVYSENGGEDWVQAEVPTTVMLTRVFFIDELTGWAVGHDGNVLATGDGGVSWILQRDGVADQAGINEQRAGRALRETEALRAQLATAPEDQLATLEEALAEAEWSLENAREMMEEAAYAPPLMDVWFSSPETGWAAGAYGVLLHTGNGGRDWADFSHKVDNPDELHFNGVVGDQDGNLYLASEWGTIFVSANGGEQWQSIDSGYDGSFFGLLLSPESGNVFAFGLLGTIYRSSDQADTWETLQSGVTASLFGAEASEDVLIFVGQGGTATATRDEGVTFTPLIQPRRDGLFGVVSLGGGGFIATGEGGSRPVTESSRGQDLE
ncbi:MAG: YCF48-related protein [Halioglobus sp.]